MVSIKIENWFVSLVGAGLALSLIGCGDPNRTSGVVHLDGVPIRKGQLIFTPEEGLRTYVDIRKGKYETFSGEPLTPGQNTVHVTKHPPPASDGTVTMHQLMTIELYSVEVDVPKELGKELLIKVFTDEGEIDSENVDTMVNEADPPVSR